MQRWIGSQTAQRRTRAADDRQAAGQFRRIGSDVRRDDRAEARADEMHALNAQQLEEPLHAAGEVGDRAIARSD